MEDKKIDAIRKVCFRDAHEIVAVTGGVTTAALDFSPVDVAPSIGHTVWHCQAFSALPLQPPLLVSWPGD